MDAKYLVLSLEVNQKICQIFKYFYASYLFILIFNTKIYLYRIS